MFFAVMSPGVTRPSAELSLRCPICRQQGTLDEIKDANDVTISLSPGLILLGQRRCPNPDCRAHIFFAQRDGKLLVSYPSERIDFDTTDIPIPIVQSFEEAITCHAN